jgi:hypothetical protein
MGRSEDARRRGEEGKPPPLLDPGFDMKAYREGKHSRRPAERSPQPPGVGEVTSQDISRYSVLHAAGATPARDSNPAATGSGIKLLPALALLFALVAGAAVVRMAMGGSASPEQASASVPVASASLPADAPASIPAPAPATASTAPAPRSAKASFRKQSPGSSFVLDVRSADPPDARSVAIAANSPRLAVSAVPAPTPAPAAVATGAVSARTLVMTHEKVLGEGCEGQLMLTAAKITFVCPGSSEESFSMSTAELKADKNGLQLPHGKKFHFKSDEMTKDQVAALFESWLRDAQR